MGGCDVPLAAAFVLVDAGCGDGAALAVVIPGSDLRPSEYPTAKKAAQIATKPKNRTSSLPVPSVISVSCEEAISYSTNFVNAIETSENPRPLAKSARRTGCPRLLLCRLRGRSSISL